jgi:hypothetical protein
VPLSLKRSAQKIGGIRSIFGYQDSDTPNFDARI